jgi:hypothetical protein
MAMLFESTDGKAIETVFRIIDYEQDAESFYGIRDAWE